MGGRSRRPRGRNRVTTPRLCDAVTPRKCEPPPKTSKPSGRSETRPSPFPEGLGRIGPSTPADRHARGLWGEGGATFPTHLGPVRDVFSLPTPENSGRAGQAVRLPNLARDPRRRRTRTPSLPLVLRLGRIPRLPLHVARHVAPALLQFAPPPGSPVRRWSPESCGGERRAVPQAKTTSGVGTVACRNWLLSTRPSDTRISPAFRGRA